MAKMEDIVKVAGYIRVSSLDQAREGVPLEVQEDAIRRFASVYQYKVVRIYRVIKVFDYLKKNGFINKGFIMQGINNSNMKYQIIPIK